MGLPKQHIIDHIADLAYLTPAWCEEGLRLIALEDISGVVATELKRLQTKYPNRDREVILNGLQAKAHHAYAAKEVRPLILESLSLACWEDVVQDARSRQIQSLTPSTESKEYLRFRERLLNPQRAERLQSKGRVVEQNLDTDKLHSLWVQRQLANRLGLNSSNVDRWEDSITLPSPENVFGAVMIALQADFQEDILGERSDLLTRAIHRTLAFIREQRYGKRCSARAERLPKIEEIATVRFAIRNKLADSFIPNNKQANKVQQTKALKEISLELKPIFGDGITHQANVITNAIKDWVITYVLFRIALVSGWHDGTEDELNWGDIDDTDSRF